MTMACQSHACVQSMDKLTNLNTCDIKLQKPLLNSRPPTHIRSGKFKVGRLFEKVFALSFAYDYNDSVVSSSGERRALSGAEH